MSRNPNARQEFFDNYVNIMFMILSLIQGLAFQDLAQKSRELLPAAFGIGVGEFITSLLFCLVSFAVLVRVIQTYLTVALDYGPKYVDLTDVLAIFGVGIVEAFMFHQLKTDQNTKLPNAPAFWIWLGILGMLATSIYVRNAARIGSADRSFLSVRDMRNEKQLQSVNTIMMLVMTVVSFVAATSLSLGLLPGWMNNVLQSVALVILIATVWISLGKTFGIPAYMEKRERLWYLAPCTPRQLCGGIEDKDDYLLTPASSAELSLICDSLLAEDPDLISAVLGVVPSRCAPILSKLIGDDAVGDPNPLSLARWVILKKRTTNAGIDHPEDLEPVSLALLHAHESVFGHFPCSQQERRYPVVGESWLGSLLSGMNKPKQLIPSEFIVREIGIEGQQYLEQNIMRLLGPGSKESIRVAMMVPAKGCTSLSADESCAKLIDRLCETITGRHNYEILKRSHYPILEAEMQRRGFGQPSSVALHPHALSQGSPKAVELELWITPSE